MNPIELRRTRLLHAIALGAIALCASRASAQRDEFDDPLTPSTGATQVPSRPTPVDAMFADAAADRVVRVVATRGVDLAYTNSLACARGRIAVGTNTTSTGLVLDGGAFVVVPQASVEGALAIVVHGVDAAHPRVAVRVQVDPSSGLALLQLAEAFPVAAVASPDETSDPSRPTAASASGRTVDEPLTSVTRDAGGALVREPAVVRVAGLDTFGVAIVSTDTAAGRVLFRDGRPVGLYAGRTIAPLGVPQVVNLAAMQRAFQSELGSSEPAIPTALVPSVESAALRLVALSSVTAADARCTLLMEDRTVTEGLPEPMPDATELRILLAIDAWNRRVSAEGATGEPTPSSLPFALVRLADESDSTETARSRFAVQLIRIAHAEEARRQSEAAALLERERAEEEARRQQERRDRRAATYYSGLASAFARDGSPGLGGAMVTGGVFGSLPRLPATGSLRAAAAIGASVGLGGNGGFSGLMTLDLGATMRFGGDHGGFLLLAYSPGVTSRVLPGASTFVVSSYRAAAGITFRRNVVYLGYRVMAPRGDYPLHLLEVGVAFRHGPPAPRTREVEGDAMSTASSEEERTF